MRTFYNYSRRHRKVNRIMWRIKRGRKFSIGNNEYLQYKVKQWCLTNKEETLLILTENQVRELIANYLSKER